METSREFERLEQGRETAFVEYWREKYRPDTTTYEHKPGRIDYYEELHLGGDLTEENVRNLLRWKDQRRLSATKHSGKDSGKENEKVSRVVARLADINSFRRGEQKTLGAFFPTGNGVWDVFIKHIARPADFPIYDRHVLNAYFRLHDGLKDKVPVGTTPWLYDDYREFFFRLYEAVYGAGERRNDRATAEKMKRIDEALFAYDVAHEKRR